MKRHDLIVYIGLSLKVKRAYYGMVHKRPPHKRWHEHWRAVLQHSAGITSETERKYEYMARHGGAASWLFLPYMSCGQLTCRHRLQRLEQKLIGLYPNSLNRMRHSGSPYKAVPTGGQSTVCVDVGTDVHVARRKKSGNCQVAMRVQMADADGAVLSKTDLKEAIRLYIAVAWHSSYPWTITQATRRFGGSMFILYDGGVHSFVGLFKAAVVMSRKWGVGQRYLGMIQRLEHEMNRPEDYDCLLALCRSEIPRSEASDLLVK